MSRSKRTQPEEKIRLVQQVAALLAAGKSVPEACRDLGVSDSSYYRWRNQFAGRTVDETVKARELQRENAQLKRLVAEQALKIAALEDVVRGKS
jgi:putative transposase